MWAEEAVKRSITMLGIMSMWMGFMNIAEKSGLVKKCEKVINPLINWLFPNLPCNHSARPVSYTHLDVYKRQVYGVWSYFTLDDGQINLGEDNYIYIGTLESYNAMVKYYGKDVVVPIYVEVENGERLERAIKRERLEKEPKYAELCRRFLADEEDFKEENIKNAGIERRYMNDDLDRCIAEIVETINKL